MDVSWYTENSPSHNTDSWAKIIFLVLVKSKIPIDTGQFLISRHFRHQENFQTRYFSKMKVSGLHTEGAHNLSIFFRSFILSVSCTLVKIFDQLKDNFWRNGKQYKVEGIVLSLSAVVHCLLKCVRHVILSSSLTSRGGMLGNFFPLKNLFNPL